MNVIKKFLQAGLPPYRVVNAPAAFMQILLASFFITLFSGTSIIILFLLAGLWLILLGRAVPRPAPDRLAVSACLLFCSWAFMTSMWTVEPGETLETSLKLAAFCLLGIVAAASLPVAAGGAPGALNTRFILPAMLAIAFIAVLEHLSGYWLTLTLRGFFQYPAEGYGQPLDKATALYTLVLPFFLGIFAGRGRLLWPLLGATAVMYLTHPMFAAALAFFSAAAVTGLYLLAGRAVIHGLFALVAGTYLLLPIVLTVALRLEFIRELLPSLPGSWLHRVQIWERTLELIAARPYAGWGLNTSDYIELAATGASQQVVQFHPHNVPLQLHLETGFIGALLFGLILLAVYRHIACSADSRVVACLLASFTAYFVFSLVSFNAWHDWWLSSLLLTVLTALAFQGLRYGHPAAAQAGGLRDA